MEATSKTKFSISWSMSRVRVLVHSLSLRLKPASNSVEDDQNIEFTRNQTEDFNDSGDQYRNGNKVMVVVDSSIEAKGALEWSLTHTVQTQDTIVLLYVVNKASESRLKLEARIQQLLHFMKVTCQRRKPGVQVEIAIREGKEKGPAIVEAANEQKVSLLVLGQRRWPKIWRLLRRLAGQRNGNSEAVQYCIQNASCMTIAVRRKGKKVGGYLITTKRHKDFWLLA